MGDSGRYAENHKEWKKMEIKLVVFDLDGVLVDSESGGNPFNLLANEITTSCKFLSDAFEKIKGHLFLSSDWISELQSAGVDIRNRDALNAISSALFEYSEKSISVFRQVKLHMPELARRIPVAILSNNCRKAADKCIDELGLRFVAIKTFEDLKRLKPDPEGLLAISEELGIKPENILFVGDSQEDLIASNEAGTKMAVAAWSTRHPFNKSISPESRSIVSNNGIVILSDFEKIFRLIPDKNQKEA